MKSGALRVQPVMAELSDKFVLEVRSRCDGIEKIKNKIDERIVLYIPEDFIRNFFFMELYFRYHFDPLHRDI